MSSPTVFTPFTETIHSQVYDAISPMGSLAGSAKNFTGAVIITGSGRGIGRCAAVTFAQAGAPRIVITARSSSELDEVEDIIKADPLCIDTEVVKIVTDISNEKDVQRLFDAAGDVEVLLNNAGSMEKPALVGESKVDEWWNTWSVNIKGTHIPTRELLIRLETSARATPVTIINTSSVGSMVTLPGRSAYQSSKSAINRFTEFVHREYPGRVRTFAYHPGSVLARLAYSILKDLHHLLSNAPELAGCYALWLATQKSADFLRGRYSSCNWDIDELVARKKEVLEKGLLFTVVAGQEPAVQPS